MTKRSKLLVRSDAEATPAQRKEARRIAKEIMRNVAVERPRNIEIAIQEEVARVMADPAEKARVGNDERQLAKVMEYVREELENLRGGKL